MAAGNLTAILFVTRQALLSTKFGSCSATTTSMRMSSSDDKILMQVCLSPGCLADGAQRTLLHLEALAPPETVLVQPGVCCSLCGNGPIVLENEKKKHRQVKDLHKLLALLFDEDDIPPEAQAVAEALQLLDTAQDALQNGQNDQAATLFAKSVQMGLDATQSRADNKSLGWVIQARLGETKARLLMNDVDGAIASATAGLVIAPSSLEMLELLHTAQQIKGSDTEELKVLQAYFSLPVPEKQTTMQANKRRQLGFRLAKLERELAQ